MMNDAYLIRAPQGAIAWTVADGWLYDGDLLPTSVEAGEMVLVVSDDGYLRGVAHYDRTPLASLLRIDTGLAVEVSMLKGRVRQLENRGQL